MLRRYKPAIITTMLMTAELSKIGVTSEGVDHFFYDWASRDEKPIRVLESPEYQLDVIVEMGAGLEDQFIADTLDEMTTLKEVYEEVITAWRSGNTAQLDTLLNAKSKQETPEIYQDVLITRNQNWLPKIDDCQNTPETEFILVGAAHLAGPESLIESLTQLGYVIEQL
jgi:uncharacterized protein